MGLFIYVTYTQETKRFKMKNKEEAQTFWKINNIILEGFGEKEIRQKKEE